MRGRGHLGSAGLGLRTGARFETSPPGPLSSGAGEGGENKRRIRSASSSSPSPAPLERGPGGEISKRTPARKSRNPWILLLLLLAAAFATPAQAHVGSPNVFYDGTAGPYPVRVIVRPPAVVPGLAEITVRIREGKADAVTVQPIQWKAGFKGAPPADVASPVPGAPDTWSAQLWLMIGSSYSVRVHVKGPAGEGAALVPVTAVPMRILRMNRGMGIVLGALGLFLFVGAVSLVGAAVRESVLTPGEAPGPRRRTWARVTCVLAVLFFALVLMGGKNWWDSVDAAAQDNIFKPFRIRTAARLDAGRPVLELAIQDQRRKDSSPLMPDHGKLMHLFLLREPGLDAFAHLHPVARTEDDFLAVLPALPAGTYRVYADVVHESGFPQTLVSTVKIPAATNPTETPVVQEGGLAPDPDDSWRATEPISRFSAPGPKLSLLEDGSTMLWHQEPLRAGREATLRFEVRGPDGKPAVLEPYMGMLSHAVISRDDGQVFVHLHPMGSINMAAQQAFAKQEMEAEGRPGRADMDHSAHMGHGQTAPAGVVLFPYEFPGSGKYRIWVQVKIGGKVLTGVFDTEVGESGPTA